MLNDFGMILGCFGDDFGMILGWFGDDFGIILGWFWDGFGMFFLPLLKSLRKGFFSGTLWAAEGFDDRERRRRRLRGGHRKTVRYWQAPMVARRGSRSFFGFLGFAQRVKPVWKTPKLCLPRYCFTRSKQIRISIGFRWTLEFFWVINVFSKDWSSKAMLKL